MEIASGQPVFLSLSFMRWRSECIVSFLSVIMVLRRFISMAEQLSPPRSFAYRGKRGASGSLPWDTSSRALIASGESGTERCELLVFSVLQGVGDMIKHSLSVSQALTLRPAISDTLQPVSLRQTNSAQAVVSFE